MRFQSVDKVSFTVKRVEEFKCPPEKAQAFMWSKDVDGLGVRSTPRGEPSFIWQGRFNGQVVRISIGPVSKVDLKTAISKARAFTGDAARLIDPRGEKREAKEQAARDRAAKARTAGELEYLLNPRKRRPDAKMVTPKTVWWVFEHSELSHIYKRIQHQDPRELN